MATTAYEAYRSTQIDGASPLELVCLLYRGAVEAVQQAQACLRQGDILGRSRQITKAMEIIAELAASLDANRGGELARRLSELYVYCQLRLTEANTQQSEPPLREVEKLLSTLSEAWEQCRASVDLPAASADVMDALQEESHSPLSLTA